MNMSAEERKSALFAGLVLQQSNMALMFLGKKPNPETNQPMRDLESARFFIDQLELLEEKTRGNLTAEEQRLLRDTLTGLRMAFVDAASQDDQAPSEDEPSAPTAATETPGPAPSETAPKPSVVAPGAAEEESHKKFTKKY